ncbi:MAG: cobalamin-dependent protein [Gammaproteobacteria bacterium]|nr:cobalamin-dependent protein [Gammaproteobacteria bacterium]
MAAEMLEASSAGFAAAANAELQSRRSNPQKGDSTLWQAHLQQRVLELAAALRVGEPKLFSSRIAWLRRAAAARSDDGSEIRLALESLQSAMQKELPDSLRNSVNAIVELALREADHEVEPEALALDPKTTAGKLGLDYIAACLDPERGDAAQLIIDAIDAGMKPEEIYCDVLLPVQKEVGQLWHVGEFSIAEERIVSETTRRVMSLIAARFQPRETNGRTMLAASVAGNTHDIGLRTVSDLFALAGWRCLYLGANVPTAEIAGAVEDHAIDLVVLTATLTPQLNVLTNAIAEINRVAPETRVLVGGIAFEDSDELWKRVGADGFARDIRDAVATGERLLEQPVTRD